MVQRCVLVVSYALRFVACQDFYIGNICRSVPKIFSAFLFGKSAYVKMCRYKLGICKTYVVHRSGILCNYRGLKWWIMPMLFTLAM